MNLQLQVILLLFIVITQILTMIICISVRSKNSIENIGPDLMSTINSEFYDLINPTKKNTIIVLFFNFKCIRCKELIIDLKERNMIDDTIRLVSYYYDNTEVEINEFSNDTKVNQIIICNKKLIANILNKEVYPYAIKLDNQVVIEKGPANLSYIKKLLSGE